MPPPREIAKVTRKLITQSWIPFALAGVYAFWDYYSTAAGVRSTAGVVKSWGISFFLLMWFVGQWLRVSKQIADKDQMSTMQAGIESIDQSLKALATMAETAAAETPSLVSAAQQTKTETEIKSDEDAVRRVLDELPKSPKGALLILGAELERELRDLLWSSGWHQGVGKATITRSIEQLEQLGVVARNLGGSVRAFLDIRNRLLHGYGVTDDEVVRAIDIGLTILRTVLSIPREKHFVYAPAVEIFSDPQGKEKRSGVHGVVLRTESPGGASTQLRAFPTTRTHFKRGAKVSWQWNVDLVTGESWYRHPDSGAITYGWSSAAEFVGQHIDEV